MTQSEATRALATLMSIAGCMAVLVMFVAYGPFVAVFTFFVPGPVTLFWAIATEKKTRWRAFFPNGIYLLCGGMVSLAVLFAFKATRRWSLV